MGKGESTTWQHGEIPQPGAGPAWPLAVDGQRVSFWAHREGEPLYYYARVVSPGEYTAEQPVLQHQKSGLIFGHGERTWVRIDG